MTLPPAFESSHEPTHPSTDDKDTDFSFGVTGWKTVDIVCAWVCPVLRIKLVLVAGDVDRELCHIGLFDLNFVDWDAKCPECIDG